MLSDTEFTYNDASNTLTIPPRQAYAIVLSDRTVLLARLDAATVERITSDWKNSETVGSYPAYTETDEPFTLAVRFPDVSAITAAGMALGSGMHFSARSVMHSLQRQRG